VVKEAIAELDHSLQYLVRYKLICYAYEDWVPPRAGPEAQVVVNTYLLRPEDADIVVCLLWQRMGTPTRELIDPETGEPYRSGTEYEFLSAYRHSLAHERPILLLYRCVRPPAPGEMVDAEQVKLVEAFFHRFSAGGDLRGLIRSFTDRTALEQLVRRDLHQVLSKDIEPSSAGFWAAGRADRLSSSTPVFFLPDNLPPDYVERPVALESLRKALLASQPQVGVVAAAAVHGQGGLGKTVLARAICEDEAVLGFFHDGILWTSLGQSPDVGIKQRSWIRALGGDVTAATTVDEGKAELQRLLRNRTMLLVIDDVWNAADAQALQVGGQACRILFTTRNALTVVGAALLPLTVMHRQESLTLLERASGGIVTDAQYAGEVAGRTGNLPLALRVIGALIQAGIDWTDIRQALNEHNLRFIAFEQADVLSAIGTSVEALPAGERLRYQELAIFPRGAPIDDGMVARLWGRTGGLRELEARRLLRLLKARALIQTDGTLHDLQYDYLQAVVPLDDQVGLHGHLVDTYREAGGRLELPDDDTYAWQRLAYHVAQLPQFEDLRSLLTDVRYLQGKIARLGTESVVADCRLGSSDDLLSAIGEALRLGAHILDRMPGELENQVYGRLGWTSVLHHVPMNTRPHFRLLSPTLTSPGGPLVRMFLGHAASVIRCNFAADGVTIISGSQDGTLRTWNALTGQSIRVLSSQSKFVRCWSFSPDGRFALSRSLDGTLRLWDVATGATLHMHSIHDLILTCAFSPDGRFALGGSYEGTLLLWDVTTRQQVIRFLGHTDAIETCALSPDGQVALSGSRDKTLRL
jgi:hypothetical protein